MKKVFVIIAVFLFVIAVATAPNGEEEQQGPDYGDPSYVNTLSPSQILQNINQIDLTIVEDALLVQVVAAQPSIATQLDAPRLATVVRSNPSLATQLDEANLVRALNSDTSLMDNPTVFDALDEKAQDQISIINSNTEIKKKWFGHYGIEADDNGRITRYDGTTVTTSGVDSTTFNIIDIGARYEGAKVTSTGQLILPNGAKATGEISLNDAGLNVQNGNVDLTDTTEPGFAVTAGEGGTVTIPDNLDVGPPGPLSGFQLTQGTVTTNGDGSYNIGPNSILTNGDVTLTNPSRAGTDFPYMFIPPNVPVNCQAGQNCARLGSQTDLYGTGINLNMDYYTDSGIDKITTHPSNPGRFFITQSNNGNVVTTWESGYLCIAGVCSVVDDIDPAGIALNNFDEGALASISPETGDMYAGDGTFCAGRTIPTGNMVITGGIIAVRAADGCTGACSVSSFPNKPKETEPNPLLETMKKGYEKITCPADICGSTMALFYDPKTGALYRESSGALVDVWNPRYPNEPAYVTSNERKFGFKIVDGKFQASSVRSQDECQYGGGAGCFSPTTLNFDTANYIRGLTEQEERRVQENQNKLNEWRTNHPAEAAAYDNLQLAGRTVAVGDTPTPTTETPPAPTNIEIVEEGSSWTLNNPKQIKYKSVEYVLASALTGEYKKKDCTGGLCDRFIIDKNKDCIKESKIGLDCI